MNLLSFLMKNFNHLSKFFGVESHSFGVKSQSGPDWKAARAGFGPRAGHCAPVL